MAAEVKAGKELLKHRMSPEQSEELRKLYRALVRKLHPDVNAAFAPKHRALWSRVQEAYRAGNLEELQALMLVVEAIPDETACPGAFDLLRARRDRLGESVRAAIDQLAALKESPPFALLAQLNDPAWVLVFQREPANEHDALAIRIHDTQGHKLGYVPRDNNEILARLMDAGKLVFGKLCSKTWHGNWLRLQIKVYMRDL